jgi:hypothetical protein
MARFKLTPDRVLTNAARSVGGSKAVPLLLVLGLCVGALILVGTAGWMLGHGQRQNEDLEPQMGPVLIAMQKIGQLHTVSFAMKDVLRQDSQQEPEGWVRDVPGVEGLVHWTTHNDALVVAQGNVEAGVDLSKLTAKDVTSVKAPDGKMILRVRLPPVTIYPPNVQLHVENASSGAFWTDDNIVPKAQAQASRRFEEAAEKQNIRSVAQDNAIQMLRQMQHTLTHADVEFYF